MRTKPLVYLALAVIVALLLQACSKLATISADKVPEYVEPTVSAMMIGPSEELVSIKWRVCEQVDDYLLVACDVRHKLTIKGEAGIFVDSYFVGAFKDEQIIAGVSEVSPTDVGFSARVNYGTSVSDDDRFQYRLEAAGTSYDRKIAQVSLYTDKDNVYEGRAVNGYWLIMGSVTDTKEEWTKVVAVDKDGKAVNTINNSQFGPSTRPST